MNAGFPGYRLTEPRVSLDRGDYKRLNDQSEKMILRGKSPLSFVRSGRKDHKGRLLVGWVESRSKHAGSMRIASSNPRRSQVGDRNKSERRMNDIIVHVIEGLFYTRLKIQWITLFETCYLGERSP